MEEQNGPSTLETQELIYKRRVKRMLVTKGVSRGKMIDRANSDYVIVPCPRCGCNVRRKFGQYGKCPKCGFTV